MSGEARRQTVSEVTRALARRFPLEWAEHWDRVGLLVGDPDAPVANVLVSLDADRLTVGRALSEGYDLLLTHHPVALDVSLPLLTGAKGDAIGDAMAGGMAIASFHTNLDRAPDGGDALPKRLGLHILGPLEATEQPVVLVTTYAPSESAEAVREALVAAGAGRVGLYEGCSFSTQGVGRFTAGRGAVPSVSNGTGAEEVRIEAVCATGLSSGVTAAIRDVHPYEEPVIVVTDAAISRGAARLGRICSVEEATTLDVFAGVCAERLGVSPRVWGATAGEVRTVAVANGSGGSLLDAAMSAGADVLLTGEVRYHDARAALDAGMSIIEAGHDATEWPLVSVLADATRQVVTDAVRVEEDVPAISWRTIERR